MKDLYSLRHELVHDPSQRDFLTEEVIGNVFRAAWLVSGCDVLLMKMLSEHCDPNLALESEA